MLYDYIIVGGGISGLSMAYSLEKKGFNILLVEKNDFCGGVIISKKMILAILNWVPIPLPLMKNANT